MNFADSFFFASKALAQVVLPPTGFLLLGLFGLLLLRRRPRLAVTALWTSTLSLLVLSMPVVADALRRSLEVERVELGSVAPAQAIMVLGGGMRRATPEFGDTLSQQSIDRSRYGATLHRRFKLPVLVTGGQVYGGRPEAHIMAEMLKNEFATPVRWVEARSRHTGENARFSAQMFKAEHIHRVFLVTHDYHMQRSLKHCSAAGLDCIPAPVSLGGGTRDSWIQYLPNVGALNVSSMAIHEYLGLLAFGLR